MDGCQNVLFVTTALSGRPTVANGKAAQCINLQAAANEPAALLQSRMLIRRTRPMGATGRCSCCFRGKKDLARKRVRGRDQLGTITVPERSAQHRKGLESARLAESLRREKRKGSRGQRGERSVEPGWAARKSARSGRAWAEGSPAVCRSVSPPPSLPPGGRRLTEGLPMPCPASAELFAARLCLRAALAGCGSAEARLPGLRS